MKKIYFFIALMTIGLWQLKAQDLMNRVDFEELELAGNSYWNGSDLSGSFSSGILVFPNNYNPDWQTWAHWVYSNMADDTTQSYTNIYSAITAAGYDTAASNGSTYALCNIPLDMMTSEPVPAPLYFTDHKAHTVEGFYVTNNTWAALSMENGDDFAKKFGGESGNDPDWFKLVIKGFSGGEANDSIEFYLADFRFEDNAQDYILKDWAWVDLTSLGRVDSLHFSLASSDVGAFGMNTPSYFCADHFVIIESAAGIKEESAMTLKVFPNPCRGMFKIETNESGSIYIYNMNGQLLFEQMEYKGEMIDFSHQPAGAYFIRMRNDNKTYTQKIIIE